MGEGRLFVVGSLGAHTQFEPSLGGVVLCVRTSIPDDESLAFYDDKNLDLRSSVFPHIRETIMNATLFPRRTARLIPIRRSPH